MLAGVDLVSPGPQHRLLGAVLGQGAISGDRQDHTRCGLPQGGGLLDDAIVDPSVSRLVVDLIVVDQIVADLIADGLSPFHTP